MAGDSLYLLTFLPALGEPGSPPPISLSGMLERILDCGGNRDVVEAILCSRNMGWADVVRGVAYFKDGGDISAYDRYCKGKGIPSFPLAYDEGDICRDDLLFEIEVDAIRQD